MIKRGLPSPIAKTSPQNLLGNLNSTLTLHPNLFQRYKFNCKITGIELVQKSLINQDLRHLVSDDILNGTEVHLSNHGVTLPGEQNALYDAGLTPIFFNRVGRIGVDKSEQVVIMRASTSMNLSSVPGSTASWLIAYRLIVEPSVIHPSNKNNPTTSALFLRCLVSTNNRIIINLVSDDDKNGDWTTNRGVTLPNGVDATYNASLSPLFIVRSGRIRIDTQDDNIEEHVSSRGSGSYSLSRVIFGLYWSYGSHYLSAGTNVQPSDRNAQTFVFPLRCLVSTNNG